MTFGSLTIWTIGHSPRTIEEFIDLLRRYPIEILVQCSTFPARVASLTSIKKIRKSKRIG